MNFPSLTRRGDSSVRDTDGDGRIDGRDDETTTTDRDAGRGTGTRTAAGSATAVTSRGPSGRVAPVDDLPRRSPT
ncbi:MULTISPECIES: hypothetical protein, partial [unclassified Micromonospora]|uniref:hypothetical protein n=1 Tax=unclassified Micromonospora TaxID=2617518 RepID=UPI0010E4B353